MRSDCCITSPGEYIVFPESRDWRVFLTGCTFTGRLLAKKPGRTASVDDESLGKVPKKEGDRVEFS